MCNRSRDGLHVALLFVEVFCVVILFIVMKQVHGRVTDFLGIASLLKAVELINLTHTFPNKGPQALESTRSQVLNAKKLTNFNPTAVEKWDFIPINESRENF